MAPRVVKTVHTAGNAHVLSNKTLSSMWFPKQGSNLSAHLSFPQSGRLAPEIGTPQPWPREQPGLSFGLGMARYSLRAFLAS